MPWIKIADATAESSRFISRSKERIKLSGVRASVEVFPGDLILSNSATPGLPKFMKINACIHDGWMILRNFKQLDKNFAYWLLLVERTNLVAQGNGSVFTNLKIDILKNHTVSIPPIDSQRRIAEFLNTLDDRIALLRETNTTLEAIAQAQFKSWFVDFDPVRTKQEGREPEGMDADTAALFPDSFEESELGLVPKGWSISVVYKLAQYINGAAYRAFEPNSECRGLPIIKIAELKAGVSSQTGYSDIKMPLKYLINTRDILFSWSGNPDTSIDTFVWPHGEAWLNQHIFRVVPTADQERSFVLLTLKYLKPVFAEIARDKQTTGLGHVTVSDLKRLQIVQPSKLLLKRWNELVDPLLERAFFVEQKAQTLAILRNTLLPRLISGQLRLPDAEALVEAVTV
jgi:type I restriction enzyme S subunit